MSSIQQSLNQITKLEDLSLNNTPLHAMSPIVKILVTLIYIILVISYPQGDFDGILLFSCSPFLLLIIGELPIISFVLRCIMALPFVVFAGVTNLIYSREVVFYIGQIKITEGEISFLTLILKTFLTIMAVLILVATTGIRKLSYGLSSLHLPAILVMQLVMTYQYLSIIAEEATSMHQAYKLRASKEKRIKLMDYGKFIGMLLLRSFDRAERVYHAMQCRGYQGRNSLSIQMKLGIKDIVTLTITTIVILLLRFINLGDLIGQLML